MAYKCGECSSPRKDEKREFINNALRITISYECGSYFILEKQGAVFRLKEERYQCNKTPSEKVPSKK